MYGRELTVCRVQKHQESVRGLGNNGAEKKRRVMAANATAEVEGQEPAALAAKERIDAVAAPTAVVDAQVAIGKEEEDVMAATAAAEEHRDTAAGATVVSTPSRGCRATIATNELAVLPAAWATYLLLLFGISCA
jgi:hypothetical protein